MRMKQFRHDTDSGPALDNPIVEARVTRFEEMTDNERGSYACRKMCFLIFVHAFHAFWLLPGPIENTYNRLWHPQMGNPLRRGLARPTATTDTTTTTVYMGYADNEDTYDARRHGDQVGEGGRMLRRLQGDGGSGGFVIPVDNSTNWQKKHAKIIMQAYSNHSFI